MNAQATDVRDDLSPAERRTVERVREADRNWMLDMARAAIERQLDAVAVGHRSP
jgi:hypothetical protein